MELKSLTYTSWARPGFGEVDLETILQAARTNNPLEGITGVLIFNGGAFFQILEGAESAVDDMRGRLERDNRHFNMFVREERLLAERAFPDWSMAYLRLDDGEFIGEQAVQHAFKRKVPDNTRNIMKALTQALPPGR